MSKCGEQKVKVPRFRLHMYRVKSKTHEGVWDMQPVIFDRDGAATLDIYCRAIELLNCEDERSRIGKKFVKFVMLTFLSFQFMGCVSVPHPANSSYTIIYDSRPGVQTVQRPDGTVYSIDKATGQYVNQGEGAYEVYSGTQP
jgi:hypothetical protein